MKFDMDGNGRISFDEFLRNLRVRRGSVCVCVCVCEREREREEGEKEHTLKVHAFFLHP